jgi:hypothetical protein
MKVLTCIIFDILLLSACATGPRKVTGKHALRLQGTWKLVTATVIEDIDTTVTDYTTSLSFIKIINDSHFAFLGHDLTQGKDSAAFFAAGGGHYSLADSIYTEYLEYCTDRTWEGNEFSFVIALKGDTLIQRGMEQIEEAGVNYLNIEKYVRVKP